MTSAETRAGIAPDDGITVEELQLATRNHGMPLEGLRYDLTPVGMHYLLTHFDIPAADELTWAVEVGGRVRRPLSLSVAELRARPAVTIPVTMECAWNGRARLHPRPLSQPWLNEAVGTAMWTGTPLAGVLADAGIEDDAAEIVFRGADHGIQGEVEHDYERSLTVADAVRDEVLLVYEVDGRPLPPQHGFPIRLLVPGWYGMTSVKWLRSITAVTEAFDGFQQWAYRLREREEDEGMAVTRIMPRALMIPPGFPVFFTRTRVVDAGTVQLEGRAWSGWGAVNRVEISADGGASWADADLSDRIGPFAWTRWRSTWEAAPGEHTLVVRASDDAGNTQPVDEPWNHHGLAVNMAQRVAVNVRTAAPS
jgi:DMSO/TMAO reductase YedYZ molybdopterin-dependent catalytic subunit